MSRSWIVGFLAAAVLAGCKSTEDCKGDAVVCGDTCVDLDSDNLNCGACGTACAAGKVCSLGACAATCAPGLVACAGGCIDPQSDRIHCGASSACTGGATCGDTEACHFGTCRSVCFWTQVTSYSLAVIPPQASVCGGSIGSQGPATVAGRSAWLQTADWNNLFVPSGLSAADRTFAAEADVYVAAPAAAWNRYSTIGPPQSSTPCDDTPPPFMLAAVVSKAGGGGAVEIWRRDPSSPGPPASTWAALTTAPLSAPEGAWHTLRIEGDRTSCSMRVLWDGSVVTSWSGTCDWTGSHIQLNAGAWTPALTSTAWSNLRVYSGSDGCFP